MNVALLAVQLLFVFIIVVLILHQYGDWQRQHFLVSFSTVVAWFLAFVIVFMLPLDVVLTFHRLCENREIIVNNDTNRSFVPADDDCQSSDIDLPENVLPILWRFVYWTSQLLTWIILPIMQSYSNAGEFTALGKLKRALINNALYYGTYLIIFAFLLLYAVSKGHYLNAGNLKTICIAASNTWGLFWLVLLLGYGLVEVPRNTWLNSKPGFTLMKLYFKLGKLMVERNDAEETVKELCQQAYLLSLQNENCSVRYPMLKVILEKFPTSMVRAIKKKAPQTIAQSDKQSSSEKMLILFHKQVIKSLQDYNRTNAQYDAAMANAIYLEDVEKNQQSPDTQALIVQNQNPLIGVICHPTIRWYFDCHLKRYLLIVLSVFCCIMSVFIVWSEMTFSNVNPPLSLAALFVHMAAGDKNYMFIEMFSITTISYMCICAYYTVFRLKVYRYYHLDSHHHTDENSLLFSAILLCRLTPPLCLNFLGIIHMDMHVTKDLNLQTETAYTKLMGHLDVIEPISSWFNIYFPMAIILLCIFTFFRLGSRLLHFIGFEQFIVDDDITADLVVNGKAMVLAERNQRKRQVDRQSRDQFWKSKLGNRNLSTQQFDSSCAANRMYNINSSGIYSNDRQCIIELEELPENTIDDERSRFDFNMANYGTPQPAPTRIFEDL